MSEQPYDPEEAEEINHIIHEGRAEERGLSWNRARYRYEHQSQPIKFLSSSTWEVISEAEWDRIEQAIEGGGR